MLKTIWEERMPTKLDLEVAAAAKKVIFELCSVRKGESLLVTVDSAGSFRVAEEIAKAGETAGAKVMLAWHSTPVGVGKVGEKFLPDPLKSAIPATDVWIEVNNQWMGYSTPYENALVPPNRVRYLCLDGLDEERIVRLIGKVNLQEQEAFQNKIVDLTKRSRKMRVTSPAGTNVSFENDPKRPVHQRAVVPYTWRAFSFRSDRLGSDREDHQRRNCLRWVVLRRRPG
jgi:2,5-dihydroxypyridine 5,6-dioxygenase